MPFQMRTIFLTAFLAILTRPTGLAQNPAQMDVEKARPEIENNFVRVVRLAVQGQTTIAMKALPCETVAVSLRQDYS